MMMTKPSESVIFLLISFNSPHSSINSYNYAKTRVHSTQTYLSPRSTYHHHHTSTHIHTDHVLFH